MVNRVAVVLAVLAPGGSVSAKDDWPQWRGADRLGVWTETGILRDFPDEGLVVKRRAPVGGGHSGPAVAGGRVFVLDYVETERRTMQGAERIQVLDEESGDVLWTHEWATAYGVLMASYATGPRATPTVDGDRVYLLGATGRIFCLDVATGDVVWEKDTVAEYDVLVTAVGLALAQTVALAAQAPSPRLPPPTGTFAVGVLDFAAAPDPEGRNSPDVGKRHGAVIRSVDDGGLGPWATRWRDDMIALVDFLEADRPARSPLAVTLARTALADLGYFGMSYGAAAAVSAAHVDQRAKVAINFDGLMFLPATTREALPGAGRVDGARLSDTVNAFVRAFFDHYLKGVPNAYPESVLTEFPEVTRFDLPHVRASAASHQP